MAGLRRECERLLRECARQQALCPGMARREVADLQRLYRRLWRRKHRLLARVLR